jgi:hypothetical protein
VETVTPEMFWELMRSPYFVRLDSHTGAIKSKRFYVEKPPEAIPGFIKGEIIKGLQKLNFRLKQQ